uniref:Endoplasmic reticulum transmembrane protein n=1 Tax=Setaria digitata TaxID=48799 RepID=A0A915Q1X2_9BILA
MLPRWDRIFSLVTFLTCVILKLRSVLHRLLCIMLGVLKGRVSMVHGNRARHIVYGQQNTSKPTSNNGHIEEIQKKIIELEKITHRSVVKGREVLWSNTSDYMKANGAHQQLRKVLTACAVVMAINVFFFIQAGRDLKRRRRDNMIEREMQRKEQNLSGEERYKIGKPFVVS